MLEVKVGESVLIPYGRCPPSMINKFLPLYPADWKLLLAPLRQL